jgi:glucose/arabinose dehydrogenase
MLVAKHRVPVIDVSKKHRRKKEATDALCAGAVIDGTPRTWRQMATVGNSYVGWGWSLDVALHPEFVNNGWIYLSHTDRCQLDCGSLLPVSMVRVVRGRIERGRWVDEQLVWSVHKDYYTVVPDGVAAGRLAFDQQGHLFVSGGGKSAYRNLHVTNTPYGKIHRVRDDGSVPEDNPFRMPEGERPASSTRHTVWSYGHRSAQGLATHPESGALWNTEMGPRGGDEVNRIVRGGNYGWPLYTNGLDYNAEPSLSGLNWDWISPLRTPCCPLWTLPRHRRSQISPFTGVIVSPTGVTTC